jgi:peptidyl-prolyl cis-trans isomerase SurA
MKITARLLFCLLPALLPVSTLPAGAQESVSVVAVVNDDAITMLDLEGRMRLAMIFTKLPDTPETRQRVAPQVLRALIEERLKLQEANRLGVKVSQAEIDDRLNSLAQQGGGTAEALLAYLQGNGIAPESLIQQIRAEIGWIKAARRQFASTIVITDDQIDEVLDGLRSAQGQPSYRVGEIFLAADAPENEPETRQTAERLVGQIRDGADFAAVARQFSQSASAAVDGDLGWMMASQLDRGVADAVRGLAPGEVSDPIAVAGGYYIITLRDRRESASADVDLVSLAQVVFPLPADASVKQIATTKAEARKATEAMTSCREIAELARQVSPPEVQSEMPDLRLSDLSPELRAIVDKSPIATPTEPIEAAGGIAVAMVCRRTTEDSSLPSREEIRNQLGNQRLEVMARSYLRDLKRTAIVDVRL